MDKTAKQIAQETRELFAKNPEAWTTGTMARKHVGGIYAEVQDPEADKFCFIGGMMRVAGVPSGKQDTLPLDLLMSVVECLHSENWEEYLQELQEECIDDQKKKYALLDSIVEWNDDTREASAAKIVEKLDCAIAKMED